MKRGGGVYSRGAYNRASTVYTRNWSVKGRQICGRGRKRPRGPHLATPVYGRSREARSTRPFFLVFICRLGGQICNHVCYARTRALRTPRSLVVHVILHPDLECDVSRMSFIHFRRKRGGWVDPGHSIPLFVPPFSVRRLEVIIIIANCQCQKLVTRHFLYFFPARKWPST